jgi:EmrB/QacA subfamily drug resistance transporter
VTTPETAPAPDGRPSGREAMPTRRRLYLVLAIVLAAAFMQLLDVNIVSIAIPPIQADLRATSAELALLVGGYLLTFACALLVSGRVGDAYGRKRVFLLGMAGFTIASALCGLAPNATILVLARLGQGLFSGLMFPQVLSVIQIVFPPEQRGKAFAIYGATLGAASILGPLLGGALIGADLFGTGWRMVFLVNLPVGLAALVLGIRFLPESRADGAQRVDVAGAALVTVGLLLLVLPLTIGRDAGWPVWCHLMLGTGLVVLAVLAAHLRRPSPRHRRNPVPPLIPWSLFGQRSFTVGLLLNFAFFFAVPPFFFYFIIYLETGAGLSPIHAGLTTLPIAVVSVIVSGGTEALGRRLGRGAPAVGCALMALGMAALVVTLRHADERPRFWTFLPALIPVGLGLGVFVPVIVSVVLAGVRSEDAGAASGALATMQQVGGAIGVAVVGALFFGFLGANADRASGDETAGLESALSVSQLPPQAVPPMVEGFRTCFHDRAAQQDIRATPVSCRQARQLSEQVLASRPEQVRIGVERAMQAADEGALARDFTRSAEQATLLEAAVFTLAFLLVLGLPRRAAARPGPVDVDADGGDPRGSVVLGR